MPIRTFSLLAFSALLFSACEKKETAEATTGSTTAPVASPPHGPLAKSSECLACHQDSMKSWHHSHHALAHRNTGGSLDAKAFHDRVVQSGHATWKFSGDGENPHLEWHDEFEGESQTLEGEPPMAIGLEPLVQYLLETGDGRYQVPDLAWDPEKEEWFNVYGTQDRRPNEWGHWTQRGMNWNSQCAYCHFTGYEKNYDSESDSYDGEWIEQGVGCAQCHGPSRANPGADGCLIDPAQKFSKEQWMHSCATCHARREEFDEKFVIGDSFFDHYTLSLPSQPGLWFPDGQQLDEVYKYSSLMMSKMGHKGITCNDCHDPHAATPSWGDVAVRTNALCLTCHAGGANGAVVINPEENTFH
ncbi:MAG: multiheme c-type cytochrome, partial [Verrucomicrobiales bacterium]